MSEPKVALQQSAALRPFHSPGCPLLLGHDSRHALCQRNTSDGSSVFVVDTEDCSVQRELLQQTEKVTAMAASGSEPLLFTANKELMLRSWNWETGELLKTWRSFHRQPITRMAVSQDSRHLATAGSDGSLRLWDRTSGITRPCRGHSGLLSLLCFCRRPGEEAPTAFASDGHDFVIRAWSTDTGDLVGELAGHQSIVTDFCVTDGSEPVGVSTGRDSVLLVWSLANLQRVATVASDESLECCLPLPLSLANSFVSGAGAGPHVATGGQSGCLRVWDVGRRRCVLQLSRSSPTVGDEAAGVEYRPDSVQLLLLLRQAKDRMLLLRQDGGVEVYGCGASLLAEWCSSLGEIACMDSCVVHGRRLIAVADGSSCVRVFAWLSCSRPSWQCRSLRLHSDTVLCCRLLPDGRLLTGGKDANVRLHRLTFDNDDEQVEEEEEEEASKEASLRGLRAVSLGQLAPPHDGHVTSLAVSPDSRLAASVCDTPTLKLFDVDSLGFVAMVTRPHEKTVNCLSISPNGKLLAAASRDKSLSLWSLPKLQLLGRLLGHRKGVWSVRFSEEQQLLLSASADGCARVWSLAEMSCQHCVQSDHPMYDAVWLDAGHAATGDQQGLVRAWQLRHRTCAESHEGHSGRVWCLLPLSEADNPHGGADYLLSGGEDSSLALWRNVTEEAAAERATLKAEQLLRQQRLQNLLSQSRYAEALGLAIDLRQPARAYELLDLLLRRSRDCRLPESVVAGLSDEQQQRLVEFAAKWNSNSRSCLPAQCVLRCLLLLRRPEELLAWPSCRLQLPALIAFTERHQRRVGQLAMCQYLAKLAADAAAGKPA